MYVCMYAGLKTTFNNSTLSSQYMEYPDEFIFIRKYCQDSGQMQKRTQDYYLGLLRCKMLVIKT